MRPTGATLPTCGNCGARDRTVDEIRACYGQAGGQQRPQRAATAVGEGASNGLKEKKRTRRTEKKRKRSKSQKKAVTSGNPGTRVTPQPRPGILSQEEERAKYPSGATQPVRDESPPARRPTRQGRRNRGGANFQDGLVNPPPTGGIARSDY